jgi:hypothetical protein
LYGRFNGGEAKAVEFFKDLLLQTYPKKKDPHKAQKSSIHIEGTYTMRHCEGFAATVIEH